MFQIRYEDRNSSMGLSFSHFFVTKFLDANINGLCVFLDAANGLIIEFLTVNCEKNTVTYLGTDKRRSLRKKPWHQSNSSLGKTGTGLSNTPPAIGNCIFDIQQLCVLTSQS